MSEAESEKPSILTQPIFLLAILLILFNIGLYFWSVNRGREEKPAQPDAEPAEAVQLPGG